MTDGELVSFLLATHKQIELMSRGTRRVLAEGQATVIGVVLERYAPSALMAASRSKRSTRKTRGRSRCLAPRTAMRNEFTPRERGLLIGSEWSRGFLREHPNDIAELKPVAEGKISNDLRGKITALLGESDDIENPTAFWAGFVMGVRAVIVQTEGSGA
jgi:hypothetical protein